MDVYEMKEIKILYLSSGTADSEMTGGFLANKLQEMRTCTITVDSVYATDVNQVMIIELLTQYDILIFDGTIENDAELNNSKYDFLNPSILLRDNFFVITRNTLPMNVVPPNSNLKQFDALRNNLYQIDQNRFESSYNTMFSNEEIVNWIWGKLNDFVTSHKEFQRPENAMEILENLKDDICSVRAQHEQSHKKQIFVSFRGRYQTEKYYGFNVAEVKDWIKNTYHEKDREEWDEPFTYDSGALTSELMPEQRVWTVQSIISSKIQESDEFWIFETLQERDDNGNIVHYSYWDSWWCVAEVMEVLQMNTRGVLNEDFKFIIFNPTLPDKIEVIRIEDLPKLTAFEERELTRLKNEGNIERSNLHLRDDKRGFRDAPWFMKKLRYKVLKIQWDRISQTSGEDISIPFDQYVEDVNCRVYEESFLTQRIYMDSVSMEIGRTREDVLKEGYCKHFLNLVGTYKDTPQYEGIYLTSTEEMESSLKNGLPVVFKRKNGKKILTKELSVEQYGTMFFFWMPLLNPLKPKRVIRTGPENTTIQEIPLYRVKL